MIRFPKPIQDLIDQFCKLPGIGPKTAERMAFFMLRQNKASIEEFAASLSQLSNSVIHCSTCHNISEKNPCILCSDTNRDQSRICVLAEPHDLSAIENTGEFKGRYHILGGVLDPLNGITPDRLHINDLLARIQKTKLTEIILAFNPDMEGEATMIYLNNLLKHFKIKITRLARGMPVGADLEYTDEVTLYNALKNRKEINGN